MNTQFTQSKKVTHKVRHSTSMPDAVQLASNMLKSGKPEDRVAEFLSQQLGVSSARAEQTVVELKLMGLN